MFVARLICSDVDCAFEEELEAPALAALEALACDCGCVLEPIGWPDWVEPAPAIVVTLAPSRRGRGLRAAA